MSADATATSRRVRMLVVSSDTYPPSRVDVAVLFGMELAGRGHRIDWLLQSEHECVKAYSIAWGGGTAWVGSTDLGSSFLARVRKHVRGILHDLKLFKHVRRDRYDIVLVKDKFVSGLAAIIAAWFSGAHFVYWLSYPFPEAYLLGASDGTGRYPFLYRIRGLSFKILLYRILMPAADHVFVQSEEMRRSIAAEGVSMSKMTAVPMGIDAAAFAPFAASGERTAIPRGERCFLYLGTLSKVRRMDFLIRVLAKVRRELPDTRLYLIGRGDDPTDEQQLIDEARRLGVLDAVVFVGQLSREDALSYVNDADVCVSPLYPTPILNVGSPTKLVEYMAMGKVVVANDHPEQKLVIKQSGAGYCVPYDEEAFAGAIVTALNNPDTARRMGEQGRKYVNEHRTYSVLADTVERHLVNVATRARV